MSQKPSANELNVDLPEAEGLYQSLLAAVRPIIRSKLHLVGVATGGVWLAERLHADLGLPGKPGIISSVMHRDDFSSRGLSGSAQATQLEFEVEGADILVLDDVLNSGRTLRAVMNELFDFGRPARIRLAVLVDRGGRELPIQPDLAMAQTKLPEDQSLRLAQDDQGRLVFKVQARTPRVTS
ncbi:MAG: bifunctional pyr operon transcriptional regulator/uracil phosphoribosyltransferase PyrR [Betaproteobacteria bacterium]|nr:bifunctional pyr operon transcriptional regulator/uracil phosphoribosyltransferase PyrR [Betaproteobacteria bacterium]NBY72433.1 bifunctional pyr operon transcriptional regulator/uracil phosphoribosyltransferase PyrR [Betaproteobacteria bacterium]